MIPDFDGRPIYPKRTWGWLIVAVVAGLTAIGFLALFTVILRDLPPGLW